MPHHTIPGTSHGYALIAFDKRGRERTDDPDGVGGKFSDALLQSIANEPVTDLLIFSHGWKGDVPSALEHYDRWVLAQEALADDLAELERCSPGFRPLRIGLHWPSQPFGDEELGDGGDFAALAGSTVDQLVEEYVERLGDSPEIRAALRTIFEVARDNAAASQLPPAARDAYLDLNAALDLDAGGAGAPPDADREPFDPDAAFELGEAEASFGDFGLGGVLSPLRQLSFWTMKKRARTVGEAEMHAFLVKVQESARERPLRIHLMGHSFGCIVVSAMLGGPDGKAPLPRPVDSVVLVQGALSIWSYCPEIPHLSHMPGYFHRLVADRKVAGPIVTTRTTFDKAVGRFYPLAAGWFGPQDFGPGDDFPPYGGLGAFGIQGLAAGVQDQAMLGAGDPYGFQAGTIYNLEASQFICHGGGFSGAHSDIAGPEVAHAIWQAALPREGAGG